MDFLFHKPAVFNSILCQNNQIDKIYDAMENDDYSEVVMAALDVLKKNNMLPHVKKTNKSVFDSRRHCQAGDALQSSGQLLQGALISYNKALLFAPRNSEEMKMAYLKRSMLLQGFKAFIASSADIDMCLAMDPKNTQFIKRKKELQRIIVTEQFANRLLSETATYINTNISKSSEIPCASDKVKIQRSDSPTVVAAYDVSPGCVLANERAFVSFTTKENSYVTCHFCQRMGLSLIPCDGCCFVLFCDENCKRQCIMEYHAYECQIMDILNSLLFGPSPNLMLKAALKIKLMHKSWKKIIKTSMNDSLNMRTGTIKEIYDLNNKFSMLTSNNERHFIHGVIYNASFECAAVIHYLKELTPFFPKNSENEDETVRAFSRIMIYITLHQSPLPIVKSATDLSLDKSKYIAECDYGFYSFIGKIKTSCTPNTMIVNKNHSLILMANQTIPAGNELTVSHLQQERMSNRYESNFNTFWISGCTCSCIMCDETSQSSVDEGKLSTLQEQYFNNINFRFIDVQIRGLETSSVYPALLEALDVLKDNPYSVQYKEVLKRIRFCLQYFELVASKNYVLDSSSSSL